MSALLIRAKDEENGLLAALLPEREETDTDGLGTLVPRVEDALLPLRPHADVAVLVNSDVNDVRAAADRTILDIFLARPCREVDGHHDLLSAGIADVAGLVFHRRPVVDLSPRPVSPNSPCLRVQVDLTIQDGFFFKRPNVASPPAETAILWKRAC